MRKWQQMFNNKVLHSIFIQSIGSILICFKTLAALRFYNILDSILIYLYFLKYFILAIIYKRYYK